MDSLPVEIWYDIIDLLPLEFNYTIYRISHFFRDYVIERYKTRPELKDMTVDILAAILFGKDEQTGLYTLDAIVQRYSDKKDYAYYKLLYHFQCRLPTWRPEYRILSRQLCLQNDLPLIKHINQTTKNDLWNDTMLRDACRFDCEAIFDFLLGETLHYDIRDPVLQPPATLLASFIILNGAKPTYLRKLLALHLIDNIPLCLEHAIMRRDIESVDIILLSTSRILRFQEYRRCLRLTRRSYRHCPEEEKAKMITRLNSHFFQLPIDDTERVSNLRMEEGEIRIYGRLVYADIVSFILYLFKHRGKYRSQLLKYEHLLDHPEFTKEYLRSLQATGIHSNTIDIIPHRQWYCGLLYSLCDLVGLTYKKHYYAIQGYADKYGINVSFSPEFHRLVHRSVPLSHNFDAQVRECLDSRYPHASRENDGTTRWITPFGLSFGCPAYTGKQKVNNAWYLIYNEEGTSLAPDAMTLKNGFKCALIEGHEIVRLVTNVFDKKKKIVTSVYEKPESLRQLETIFNGTAYLHWAFGLVWHLRIASGFSCLSNPFDMTGVHASAGDSSFEVNFGHLQNESNEKYLSLDSFLTQLKDRKLLPQEKVCCVCKKLAIRKTPLPRCTKCKARYYCDIECQRKDWKELAHAKECKVKK